MFNSFQTKLVVIFVILIASVQLVTFIAVYNATTHNVIGQVKNQLIYTSKTFKGHLYDRAHALSESAAILTSDFAFRETIATADQATSLSVIQNLAARIKADRVLLISMDNEIIADTRRPVKAGESFPFEQLIEIADEENLAESIVVIEETLYEFVIVPVLGPIPIAWVGIGIQIDSAMVSNLRELSPLALDISFLQYNQHQGWKMLASTLDPALYAELPRMIAVLANKQKVVPSAKDLGILRGPLDPIITPLAGSEYVNLISPVNTPDNSAPIIALLQYPLDIALDSYQPLFFWLSLLSVSGLLLITLGAMVIARGVTKPVRTLMKAAHRIEHGNYQQRIDLAQKDELGRLATTFNIMMDGIAEREEKIRYQAHHDVLTGLPNRLQFELISQAHIKKVSDSGAQFSIIHFGIKRLHEINNTLGHHVGDTLIQRVSQRLEAILKEGDTLARLASNTFILLLIPARGESNDSIAENILTLFEQPFSIDDINIDVHVQMGISCYPQHSEVSNQLMQKADVAMYTAYKSGKRFAVYDAQQDTYSRNRLSLMSELKQGIDNNELELYYQPKIDVTLQQATHVEALVRWIHKVNGFMPPDEFIPMAEQTGHIHKLTLWVLDQAIRQCCIWFQGGIDLRVAVNLSAKDLLNRQLPGIILEMLNKHQLPTNRLILEITESALMQDPDVALMVLTNLSQLGLTISIDDFGTGYSSMEYLKKLPVDILKIDKSFVMELSQNRNDAILVQSMIQLAHNLGLKVVAEGVEDEESLNILSQYQCDYVQGFYISRPLPVEKFDQWIKVSPWASMAYGGHNGTDINEITIKENLL